MSEREYKLSVILMFWLFVNFITCLVGVTEGSSTRDKYWENKCDKQNTRAGYAFPGFKIGCWLAEPIETKKD